jgi:hypothetical protein
MFNTRPQCTPKSIPVLLLKTKSNPGDAYEEAFSSREDGDFAFEPRFLPVLEHRFDTEGLRRLGELLESRGIGGGEESSYGGLIFTSQRAVEAFAKMVDQGKGPPSRSPSAYETWQADSESMQVTKDGHTCNKCLSTVLGRQPPELSEPYRRSPR